MNVVSRLVLIVIRLSIPPGFAITQPIVIRLRIQTFVTIFLIKLLRRIFKLSVN